MRLPRWLMRPTRRTAIPLLVVGVTVLLLGLLAYGNEIAGAICNDGWESQSGNPGRCSSHGGVDQNRYVNTLFGQQPPSWIGLTRWPAVVTGGFGTTVGLGLMAVTAPAAQRKRRDSTSEFTIVNDPTSPLDGDYLELSVDIEPTSTGYAVEITTPTGQSQRSLHKGALPADRGLAQLSELVATASKRRFGSKRAKAVEKFGTELFDALFDGSSERAYRTSIDFVREHNAVLRVVLQVDGAFADIPWEYLYDAKRAAFLARSRETSLVRLLDATDTTRTQTPIATLKILSMSASPHHSAPLDVQTEQAQISAALAPSITTDDVELHFVEDGTLTALTESLHRVQPHVFHFAGHGDWSDDHDDAVLLFEDDHGHAHPVNSRTLGSLLNQPGLRLAVFNSCNAARPSTEDRFAGIASSLVAQGVPAAVGMQFRFDDQAAVTFAHTFLQRLGDRSPVDQALTDARLAVLALPNEVEWGTPVLITRIPLNDLLHYDG